MQLIIDKYGNHVVQEAAKLSFSRSVAALLNFVKRQAEFVQRFDDCYLEQRLQYFMPIVDLSLDINATSADKEVLARMSEELELALPDSDEFVDIEGTLAQNALISAIYAIRFIQSGDMADFCSSVDKVLETVDALAYYETNGYAEDVVMAREVGVLESLVQVAGLPNTEEVFAKLDELARTHPVYGELPAKHRTGPS